jgi:hypothetical protein
MSPATAPSANSTSTPSTPAPVPFPKSLPGLPYLSLYTFTARDENDITCERGTFVKVLNKEDPDWFWVQLPDGGEGFLPSGFLRSVGLEGNGVELQGQVVESTEETGTPAEGHVKGVELVMLYDYKASISCRSLTLTLLML